MNEVKFSHVLCKNEVMILKWGAELQCLLYPLKGDPFVLFMLGTKSCQLDMGITIDYGIDIRGHRIL